MTSAINYWPTIICTIVTVSMITWARAALEKHGWIGVVCCPCVFAVGLFDMFSLVHQTEGLKVIHDSDRVWSVWCLSHTQTVVFASLQAMSFSEWACFCPAFAYICPSVRLIFISFSMSCILFTINFLNCS